MKFPHPYQGAFTVASDIDSASVLRFRAVHALFCDNDIIKVNSPDWNTLGLTPDHPRFEKEFNGIRGFGFELGDSFFLIGDPTTFGMHRYLPSEDGFCEVRQDGENCADVVRQNIRRGQIDSFHAFLHYRRRQVEPLLRGLYEWCEREHVSKPRVWVNHSAAVTPSGLCPEGMQPSRTYRLVRLAARYVVGPLFGRKRHPLRYAFVRYSGDTPGSPYYINDILSANGLRYAWLNMDDSHRDRIALPERQSAGRSTILEPVTMDDGIKYWRFQRCYGSPSVHARGEVYLRNSEAGFDGSHLLTEANLESLCRLGGSCILYTHWTHYRSMPLSAETLGRFELLRRWQAARRVWVTSTSRLLEWTRLRTFLKLGIHREGRHLIVDIQGVDDPIFGKEPVDLKTLDGLSLRIKDPEHPLTIALNGQRLETPQVVRSGDLAWINSGEEDGDSAPVDDRAASSA
ncbi:MAG TPA: hypothetical protein VFE51_00355 [Verrucomicrobiae bacterium]|nr:hypothetical protein [Verrucomicrobiae bacterium]